MVINQTVSREVWRRLVESLKAARDVKYIPEYGDDHDTHVNKRYYH